MRNRRLFSLGELTEPISQERGDLSLREVAVAIPGQGIPSSGQNPAGIIQNTIGSNIPQFSTGPQNASYRFYNVYTDGLRGSYPVTQENFARKYLMVQNNLTDYIYVFTETIPDSIPITQAYMNQNNNNIRLAPGETWEPFIVPVNPISVFTQQNAPGLVCKIVEG